MGSTMIRPGEIWFASLDSTEGSEIRKRRPAIIVSNDASSRASGLVTIVPLTSKVERVFPFEVLLPARLTGLTKDSKACAQHVRTISKQRLAGARAGLVPAIQMRSIEAALKLHLALD
jgi:mRNA interferase MazF